MSESAEEIKETKPNFFKKFGGWVKKHKVLTVLAAVVIVGGIAAAIILPKLPNLSQPGGTQKYSFIRTVTLQKGSLDSVVSVTGTVNSSDTSNVTYSSSGMSAPKVKTVEVAVGDYVEKGDVIVTLDTTDINDSISKELENISDRKETAQKNYDKAVKSYNEAKRELDNYDSTYNSAYSTYKSAYNAYNPAYKSLLAYDNAHEKALSAMQTAGNKLNDKTLAYNSAESAKTAADSAYEAAKLASEAAPDDASLSAALTAAESAQVAAQTKFDTAKAELETATTDYNTAKTAEEAADKELNTAKANSNYDVLSKTYETAEQAYDQAKKQYESLEKAVDNAKDSVDSAKETLDDAGTSDNLEDLYEQLEDCKLKAETSGKVTSLSAEVGSTPAGTVATIQDVESLKIAVTIEEANINNVEIGMSCRITSDATGSTVINGTLSQIDPVAGQSGTFGAEVTVDDKDTKLLVGMNASVDIVLSSTADVFTVPIDAIGNDDDGSGDYVYRQTGGEGTDLTFEKVYVTTGEKNDYYVEISSASLAAGDVIRASSDLTQGLESADQNTSSDMAFMMGGGMGGEMTTTDMPSGGMGGGERPSGGAGGEANYTEYTFGG